MKFRPEIDRTEGIPSAEPGIYTMRISAWFEDKQTKNGTKDLVEFVGEIGGTTVGASMWISHPENGKKGNLWKYRQLAEALGDDATEQYRSKDGEGYSLFKPTDWTDRAVEVEVGAYGVETVSRLEQQPSKRPASKERTEDNWDKSDEEITAEIAAARIAKKAASTTVSRADDDIPF